MDLEKSSKLDSSADVYEQYVVRSAGIVLYRLLQSNRFVKVLTATAAEDDGSLQPYPDLNKLNDETLRVFSDYTIATKKDRSGRPYVEFTVQRGDTFVESGIARVGRVLGLDAIEFPCESDLSSLYHELCVEDGEDVYLSDGMVLTPDGRIREAW